MDPIIWEVMIGFVDDTKWPTRAARPAMERTNEATEFRVSRPGPTIRPLQITPAHGRHVSGVLSELAFVLSELPSLNVGAGMPVIGVAETKDAIEVNAELPGVDEKDIKVSLARGGAQLRFILPVAVLTFQTGGWSYRGSL
jgi:HSP20 family molecular chaperone IbpA